MSETTSHITRIEQDRTIASATPPTPDLDAVSRAVYDALCSHRLRHQTDDLGNGYPLVDALTPDGDASIERGQEELEALADHIVDTLAAVARPAPLPADVQAVMERVRVIEAQAFTEHGEVMVRRADLRTLLAHFTREAR